jgi:putative DNA primase/helicase
MATLATPEASEPDMLRAALWYAKQGFPVFPCRARRKEPLTRRGFKDASTERAQIEAWWTTWPNANIGIPTGTPRGLLVLDCDPRNGGPGDRADLIAQCGEIPSTAEQITGGGGRHVFFHYSGGPVPKTLAPGIELKGDGGYVIVAPSVHPSGNPYQWDGITGPKALLHLAEAPPWLAERISSCSTNVPVERSRPQGGKIREGGRNNFLTSLAGTMRRAGMSHEAIEAALLKENLQRCDPPLPNAEVQRIAASIAKYEPAVEPPGPDLLHQHHSDYGNSRRLIALYGDEMRYCHATSKWLIWDGRRWAEDDGERARYLAQKTMLEFAQQASAMRSEDARSFAGRCLNSQRITNLLREAQGHLAIRPAELDTHPDVLNFANGTLDLKAGLLRPHLREDFITKLVHHNYQQDATCPLFMAFLNRITANHPGLARYLQLAFGYSLTGRTGEKAVFLLHGRGNNGKTTLLSTFLKLLAEYAVLLQIDTLMVRQENNNTLADLADLRGARFVMTSETEEGQRLSEGKLKRITQGMGRIKATRKYENPIEFPETHKLWIDANHLPIVRGTDNAIWNRLHAIPFDSTIATAEQDKSLPDKLTTEAEGILSWAVAGAVRWYVEGLGKPPDVEAAGDTWRAQSDHIRRFIEEACIRDGYAQVKARRLYLAYKSWAAEAGEHPVTETVFGLRLIEDFRNKHTNRGKVYYGIGLRAEAE